MKRLTLLLLSILLALAFAGLRPAAAWAGGGDDDESGRKDNAAVAINTKDDSSIFKFAFSIRRVAGDVVDETNTAIAYNQCERCRAVAVAIQIVLVFGSPSVVTPTNVAVAVNYECTLCESLAMAYQFVIGVPEDFEFSHAALDDIKQIRKEIRRLRKEDLTIDELRTRIDALADRLRVILREEIARHERERDRDNRNRRRPPPRTTTTGTIPTETDLETFPTIVSDSVTTDTATTTTETTPTTTTTTTTTTTP